MAISTFVKRVQTLMRKDPGVGTNDVLILEQLTWLLFLFIYDYKEKEWELFDDNFKSIIPEHLRWRSWAIDDKDGQSLTGDNLLDFIDQELLKGLKGLEITEETEMKKQIVQAIFRDANNYMKNGILIRQLVNIINELNFDEIGERHAFNDIYETLLKSLQTAGNSGQYFTPRACTNIIAEFVAPQIGETVADFAAGTGGFLVSAMQYLIKQEKNNEDRAIINKSLMGIEKFHLPYLLGVTNLILHGVESPNILHKNSFDFSIKDLAEKDKVDCILMNPPFGSKSEETSIQNNFPKTFQTSETADLFMAIILHKLKLNGRAGVILPDGFLFDDGVKERLKEKLLNGFNLHTILRLPKGVFAPYTTISTNILFFERNDTGTEDVWYFEVPYPEGYKTFSKTKPMLDKHFDCVREWWTDRKESEYTWKVSKEDLVGRGYNLDIKNPNKPEEESHDPEVLMQHYTEVCKKIDELQNTLLDELKSVL